MRIPETKAPVKAPAKQGVIDKYSFVAKNIPINVTISISEKEYVPQYIIKFPSISRDTEFVLEKIRQELVKKANFGMVQVGDVKKVTQLEDRFKKAIIDLTNKHFPNASASSKSILASYLIAKSLGLGKLEFVLEDSLLEEIVVNSPEDPIWVYHKKHGWLKTNIYMDNNDQTRHYASVIGRQVGREITVLSPLLDAHLKTGDRANATLNPISTRGNTITLRKFARDPWTITKFLESKTTSVDAAAFIWLAIEYELSILVAGGTASGKTSMLNVLGNLIPPNQRIISIEDTREIRLPGFLHWVPMNTRLPNPEGKGAVSMEDLLVNSLRMRPDRILVGEVRRAREAETLFEAIHTGHSVYATFHANNATETVDRLTHAPINVPPIMLPAISLIVVQFRNRRTGLRRTFQVAEILPNSSLNVLMQYDSKKDTLVQVNKSQSVINRLTLYTGLTEKQIALDLEEKKRVLSDMVKNNISHVEEVGQIVAQYYTNRARLLKTVR